jgi:hypothetical protein
MKKQDNKIIEWPRLFFGFNAGIFLSIVFIILPFGLHGNSLEWMVMEGADFLVILSQWQFLVFGAGMTSAMVSVFICAFILTIALMGTLIVHLKVVIKILKMEIKKLKKQVYELINSSGRGDN